MYRHAVLYMESLMGYWEKRLQESEPDMLPDNFEKIKQHIRRLKAAGRSEQTTINHITSLMQFGSWANKPFDSLSQDDLLCFWEHLDKHEYTFKGKTKKYSEGTKTSRLITVKAFLNEINPEAANVLKPKTKLNKKLPEDLLIQDEVRKLIDSCPNARDRALLATLYESGARRGEIYSILIRNIEFDINRKLCEYFVFYLPLFHKKENYFDIFS